MKKISAIAKWITRRVPPTSAILGLYGVIVFFIFSWTLLVSFYKFPSWILYLTIDQILVIYAYNFSVNVAESLLALAVMLLLELTVFFIFMNKDEMQTRPTLLFIFILGSAMWRLLLFQNYQAASAFVEGETLWWAITLALAFPGAMFLAKIKFIQKAVEAFAERATVFLYIYLPLGLVSLIVISIRNIN